MRWRSDARYWVSARTRNQRTSLNRSVGTPTSRSGDGAAATRACAGEPVEHRARQAVATADAQAVRRALRTERAHPRRHRAAHGRRRLLASDLGDLGAAAIERDQVLALRHVAFRLHDQLDG